MTPKNSEVDRPDNVTGIQRATATSREEPVGFENSVRWLIAGPGWLLDSFALP
jgi:hypothetical protein